jgi:hypothetical protein
VDRPGLTIREIAEELDLSEAAVRVALQRIRQREGNDITKFCPECFRPTLRQDGGEDVCTKCGVVVPHPEPPALALPFGQHPELDLHPGRNLGSHIQYGELLKAKVIRLQATKHYVEKPQRLEELCNEGKSQLWALLKGLNLPMEATNQVARLLVKNIRREYSEARRLRRLATAKQRTLIYDAILKTLLEAVKTFPELQQALEWFLQTQAR